MITTRSELCPQNHPCPSVSVCPAGAITQQGNQAPVVDHDLCTSCGLCTYSCPVFVEVAASAAAARASG